MKMTALVQEGYGSPEVLHLRQIEKPAVTENGVLIAVHAASVNASDYHYMHGILPIRVMAGLRRPRGSGVRGFDVAGVVEAVGPSVREFKPGDEVFGFAGGSFADFALADPGKLALKPRRLSFEEAAAVPGAASTALQGLRDTARVAPGESVAIFGAGGGVGTFAVQIARGLGARVTAVTSTDNMGIVSALEPDELIDYSVEDVTKGPPRFGVFFDVAATLPIADCVRVLLPGGRLVIAGAAKGGVLHLARRLGNAYLRSHLRHERVTTYLARVNHDDLVVLANMIDAGQLRPVIDRVYPLREAAAAMAYVATGHARAKVVIGVA